MNITNTAACSGKDFFETISQLDVNRFKIDKIEEPKDKNSDYTVTISPNSSRALKWIVESNRIGQYLFGGIVQSDLEKVSHLSDMTKKNIGDVVDHSEESKISKMKENLKSLSQKLSKDKPNTEKETIREAFQDIFKAVATAVKEKFEKEINQYIKNPERLSPLQKTDEVTFFKELSSTRMKHCPRVKQSSLYEFETYFSSGDIQKMTVAEKIATTQTLTTIILAKSSFIRAMRFNTDAIVQNLQKMEMELKRDVNSADQLDRIESNISKMIRKLDAIKDLIDQDRSNDFSTRMARSLRDRVVWPALSTAGYYAVKLPFQKAVKPLAHQFNNAVLEPSRQYVATAVANKYESLRNLPETLASKFFQSLQIDIVV